MTSLSAARHPGTKQKHTTWRLPSLNKSYYSYTGKLSNFADLSACTFLHGLTSSLSSNHSLKQMIFSSSNDNSLHPTEHRPPLHLPQANTVKKFFCSLQWAVKEKQEVKANSNCLGTPFSHCTCKWPLVQRLLHVNRSCRRNPSTHTAIKQRHYPHFHVHVRVFKCLSTPSIPMQVVIHLLQTQPQSTWISPFPYSCNCGWSSGQTLPAFFRARSSSCTVSNRISWQLNK